MAVMKPRYVLLNFRVTEEERAQIQQNARTSGARSISDYVRAVVMNEKNQVDAEMVKKRLDQICRKLGI